MTGFLLGFGSALVLAVIWRIYESRQAQKRRMANVYTLTDARKALKVQR